MLSKPEITRYLDDAGLEIIILDETASTNAHAAGLAGRYNGDILVAARQQTAGRGTRGRSFYCGPNEGLYFSLLSGRGLRPLTATLATPAAAVAVVRALEEVTGVQAGIKWVNDITIEDRKVCGILAESKLSPNGEMLEYLVVGIGLNLFVQDFPQELRGIATSLDRHAGAFDSNRLLAIIINHLIGFLNNLEKREFMAEYRARSTILGRSVYFDLGGVQTTGLAVEINNEGNLVVQMEGDRRYILAAGDVSLRFSEERQRP